MSKINKLFFAFPASLQNIACSIEGWRIKRQRFGGNFQDLLAKAEMRDQWNDEQIIEYRNIRLKFFLQYCRDNIPFYKNYFSKHKIDVQDITSIEDLATLPIITKKEINNNGQAFRSDRISQNKLIPMHTSGSTGSPLHFYTTKNAIRELWAIFWRYRRRHGIDFDTWGAYLLGKPIVPIENKKPPFWRVNVPGKQLLMSGLHLNKDNSIYYLKELKRRKLKWIYGYPSLISLLAKYKIEHGIDLTNQIKWVTTNSENLLSEQEEIIRKAFHVKPVQLYGMIEAVANISECPSGSLHVDDDYSAVEFIKIGDIDGYKIVGTNYSNYATAFLRYEVNDIFQVSDRPCPCGIPGRIVKSIDGRKEDNILLKDGRQITRMDIAFKAVSNIIEAQIVQNNFDELTVRVVKGKHYSDKDEALMLNSLKKRLGENINIKFEYMDGIPRTKNGKLRLVISELNKEHFS